VDGAAYWPDGADGFFETMGSTHDAELARYDAVLFFETAAGRRSGLRGRQPLPNRDQRGGTRDSTPRLHGLWSSHPDFHLVPHHESFLRKITVGLSLMESIVASNRRR